MNKVFLAVLEIVLLAGIVFVVTNAANNPSREVTVNLSEYKVNMASRTLPVNVPVTFKITNQGAVVHEAVLEKAGAKDEPIEYNGVEQEAEDIQMGETRPVSWTVTESGNYELACY